MVRDKTYQQLARVACVRRLLQVLLEQQELPQVLLQEPRPVQPSLAAEHSSCMSVQPYQLVRRWSSTWR
jgi:hypothetical protein